MHGHSNIKFHISIAGYDAFKQNSCAGALSVLRSFVTEEESHRQTVFSRHYSSNYCPAP